MKILGSHFLENKKRLSVSVLCRRQQEFQTRSVSLVERYMGFKCFSFDSQLKKLLWSSVEVRGGGRSRSRSGCWGVGCSISTEAWSALHTPFDCMTLQECVFFFFLRLAWVAMQDIIAAKGQVQQFDRMQALQSWKIPEVSTGYSRPSTTNNKKKEAASYENLTWLTG